MLQRIDLADRIDARAAADARASTGSPDDTLVTRALDAARRRRRGEPRWRVPHREAHPGRRRPRRRQLRRRDRARARERSARRAARRRPRCTSSRRGLGADVPFFLDRRPAARRRATGTDLEPLDLPQDYWIVLVAAARTQQKQSTARVYDASTTRRRRLRRAARRAARAARRVRRPSDLARCRRTTSRRRRSPTSCARSGAFRADVSGAGPAVYGLFHRRARRRGGRSARFEAPRARLDHGTSVVRLIAMGERPRSRRTTARHAGRLAAPAQAAYSSAGSPFSKSILAALTHSVSQYTIIVLGADHDPALPAVGQGSARHDQAGRWIVAASQALAIVASLLAHFIGLFVLVLAGLFAAVALFLIFPDRR